MLIPGNGLLQGGNLILGNVVRDVLTIFPGLVIVVRALGSLAEDAELTSLHVLDLSDLLQERLGLGLSIHANSI